MYDRAGAASGRLRSKSSSASYNVSIQVGAPGEFSGLRLGVIAADQTSQRMTWPGSRASSTTAPRFSSYALTIAHEHMVVKRSPGGAARTTPKTGSSR